MNKAYIETWNDKTPLQDYGYHALIHLEDRYDICLPTRVQVYNTELKKGDLFIGSLDSSLYLLKRMGLNPKPINYPECLRPFLGSIHARKAQEVIDPETLVWDMEWVEFQSEWRVFVHRGVVKGVSHYSGDPLLFPNADRIREMITAWGLKTPPVAYALDVGLCKGETLLVEVKDAFALGSYGLNGKDYVDMIEDRWLELTGVMG